MTGAFPLKFSACSVIKDSLVEFGNFTVMFKEDLRFNESRRELEMSHREPPRLLQVTIYCMPKVKQRMRSCKPFDARLGYGEEYFLTFGKVLAPFTLYTHTINAFSLQPWMPCGFLYDLGCS